MTASKRIDPVLDGFNNGVIDLPQMKRVIESILRKEADGNPPEASKPMMYELDLTAEHNEQ